MKYCVWLLMIVLAAATVGCSDEEKLDTVPVTGTVTLNGTPVEGAQVTFVPVDGGMSAVGLTDASGKYSLTTRSKDDGAMAGSYSVRITKYEGGVEEELVDTSEIDPEAVADITDEYPEDYDPAAAAAAAAAAPPPKNLLPARYADPNASGLTASVESGEPQTFDFELEG